MIGIPIALAYTNISEWLIHKYWLHGLGKNKQSFWSFHWHQHHREARKLQMYDPHYRGPIFAWSPKGKEVLGLVAGALVVTPLFPIAPFFTVTCWYRTVRYYQVHKRAHLDPAWAKEHLPWHYDHHMGTDQNANWCVTHPWFDHVMGTRKKYRYDAQGRVVEQLPPVGARQRFARAKQRIRAAISSVRVAV